MNFSIPQVLNFGQGTSCRVEYVNNVFNFYGLRPDKPCLPVQPKDMLVLSSFLLTATEKAARTRADLAQSAGFPDKVVATFPITTNGVIETVLDVQTYKGDVSIWLKTFKNVNGVRRGLPGWVMLNDLDGETLKGFYLKCFSS